MRPINLIPPEERRGGTRPGARTNAAPYLLVAALLAAVFGLAAISLADRQIGDKEADVARLEAEEQAAKARADALAPYARLANVRDAREQTVGDLARSRFDWQRVLRELALVMPSDVWLVKATGSVTPDVQVTEGAGVGIRSTATGPALELVGCGSSQGSVAGFVAALQDIDGVTRVTLAKTERPGSQTSEITGSSADDCRTRDFIAKFEIVAAFDPEGAV